MEKEFVSFDQAVVLSELKYDGDYNYTYTIDKHLWYGNVKADGVSKLAAPLKQQVFRWLREKHNIVAPIYSNASGYLYEWHDALGGTQRGWSEFEGPNDGGVWNTYEEAENACIDKLIEIAKQQSSTDDTLSKQQDK